MCTAVKSLFQLLCQRVTEQDIRDFCPGDPGYQNYVYQWTRILNLQELPDEYQFDVSEVVGLTCWSTASYYDHPKSFQLFRLFTTVVAFHLYNRGIESDIVCPVNCTAIRLINDAHTLKDSTITSLIGDMLNETALGLKTQQMMEDDYPFLYAAEMIWAQRIGDYQRADEAAKFLLEGEQAVRANLDSSYEDSRFLLGISLYDMLYDQWAKAFAKLTNPNDCEETQLVIEALLQEN